jgi:hypothetical protein
MPTSFFADREMMSDLTGELGLILEMTAASPSLHHHHHEMAN